MNNSSASIALRTPAISNKSQRDKTTSVVSAKGASRFIGCFKDTSDFDLDGYVESSQKNTPQACMEACRKKGFKYAGVQYSESCLCSNSYGKYGAADNCDYKCSGDPNAICGGYSANSVYEIGDFLIACDYVLSAGLHNK